jgi:hypothetical protein
LVAEQEKLQLQIDEIDQSIQIITECSNIQRTTPTPQPQDVVTKSLLVFRQRFGRDPVPNERVEFRLG